MWKYWNLILRLFPHKEHKCCDSPVLTCWLKSVCGSVVTENFLSNSDGNHSSEMLGWSSFVAAVWVWSESKKRVWSSLQSLSPWLGLNFRASVMRSSWNSSLISGGFDSSCSRLMLLSGSHCGWTRRAPSLETEGCERPEKKDKRSYTSISMHLHRWTRHGKGPQQWHLSRTRLNLLILCWEQKGRDHWHCQL